MAKIHTHYDNLKVARLAPQEVVRAAYKALSQKYHPDKNPGDEKAARIMAILNSAYGILSDPVRRKEHDEWIAAEEWEIEWLESTHADDGRDKPREGGPAQAWEPRPVAAPVVRRLTRDPAWWFGLALCFALGCAAGILLMGQQKILPVALAAALGARPDVRVEPVPPVRADPAAEVRAAGAESAIDTWAVRKPHMPEGPDSRGPEVKTLAVTQLIVPERSPDCETELHTLIAPNGEPWPAASGYLDGFPVGNRGDEMQFTIDNTVNASPVLVKLYDLERRSNVRHVYILAHDTLVIENLAAGKYELRYQNIEVGGTQAECVGRRNRALKQAAAPPPQAPNSGL